MIDEQIQGIGPLRPEPDKPSTLIASLCEALWYISDGRPYEELLAASGIAFATCAAAELPCPAAWIDACPDLALDGIAASCGLRLHYGQLDDPGLARRDPATARARLHEILVGAVEDRRPLLARGGWPAPGAADWGVVTGLGEQGPVGRSWYVAGGQAVALVDPIWQLLDFSGEQPRPGAAELSRQLVSRGAALLAGDGASTALGQTWLMGRAAFALWAERLRQPRPCPECSDAACLARLGAYHHANRRWAGRYLQNTAALGLGAIRPARAAGRAVLAVAERYAPFADAATMADPGARAALADELEAIGEAEAGLAGELSALAETAPRR